MAELRSGAPRGWLWAKLGDLVEFRYGKGLPESKRDTKGRIPVYGSNGVVGYHSTALVDKPCVIVGRKGAAGEVHVAASPSWPIDTTYFVVPPEGVDLAYLSFLLGALRLSVLDRSTAIPGLNRNDAYAIVVPLPPFPEQHRIVAKIEELFSDLDAGVEALKKIKAELKRYKQAVLKAAVEGKLTEEWREKNKDKLEPASVLLERIRAERAKNGKAKKLPPIDTSELPRLPGGWEWARVEDMNPSTRHCAYGVLQPGQNVKGGIPLVRVGDIDNGRVDTGDMKRIDPSIAARYPRTTLEGGEVLITLVGAIGRTAVVPRSLAGANTARAVGVIPLVDAVSPEWVEVWFRNPEKIEQMTRKAHEVARKTLNLEDVRAATVALPSLAEQLQIVSEVEQRLSVADEVEKTVEAGLKQAGRLRESILKRAFEGKLVQQDPSDEPAQKLLQRIKESRGK